MANSSRNRRIAKELAEIHSDAASSGINAIPIDPDRLISLQGSFPGPPDSPYEGGTFVVKIDLPDNYPFRPPAMKFETKVWHPNISSQTGAICLDTLSTGWTPVNTIKSTIMSLRMLLESPNPTDPQDAQVAQMLIETPELFKLVAHDWAVRYAGAPRTFPLPSEYKGTNQRPEVKSDDPAQYRGYNKNLVTRFTDMGFSVESVVSAFIRVGIERNDGRDYPLEEAYIGDVTAFLFNEP